MPGGIAGLQRDPGLFCYKHVCSIDKYFRRNNGCDSLQETDTPVSVMQKK